MKIKLWSEYGDSNKRSNKENGAIAIIVAILMTVFLGFTALVVDTGYMYSVRRQLQTAADSAALAGCQALIKEQSEAEILQESELYAEGDGSTNYQNNVQPAAGLEMMYPDDAPLTVTSRADDPSDDRTYYTEIGDNFVRIAVRRTVNSLFSSIFGLNQLTICAQSRANIAYITGMKNLVPWGIPIIKASKVSAQIGSGPEVELSDTDGDNTWTGSAEVTATVAGTTVIEDLTIKAYNSEEQTCDGFPETLTPAAKIVLQPPIAEYKKAGIGDNGLLWTQNIATVDSSFNASATLYIETLSGAQPSVNLVGGSASYLGSSGSVHSFSLNVNTADNIKQLYEIMIGTGNNRISGGELIARRPTYPIKAIKVQPAPFFESGSNAQISVAVTLNDYEFGVSYPLKVVGGAGETGNFCALDLTQTFHYPNYQNPQPTEYNMQPNVDYHGDPYYYFIENPFNFAIHLGDVIWTQTGNKSESQTLSALKTRFAGVDMSWDAWLLADKPASNRLVYVPVMEKMKKTGNDNFQQGGSNPLRVVSFAAFYLEKPLSTDSQLDTIWGRFVEYVAPADAISEDPPPDAEYYMQTPHLVSDGMDF